MLSIAVRLPTYNRRGDRRCSSQGGPLTSPARGGEAGAVACDGAGARGRRGGMCPVPGNAGLHRRDHQGSTGWTRKRHLMPRVTPRACSRRRVLLAALGPLSALLVSGAVIAGCDPGSAAPTGSTASTAPVGSSPTIVAPAVPYPAAPSSSVIQKPEPADTTTTAAPEPASPSEVGSYCGPGDYRNVDGNCVQRPTHTATAPPGATAQCRDGSYSFSQHRQGTCSGHDGVAEWL